MHSAVDQLSINQKKNSCFRKKESLFETMVQRRGILKSRVERKKEMQCVKTKYIKSNKNKSLPYEGIIYQMIFAASLLL